MHAIFNEVEGAINDLLVGGLAGLISRYEDPLAAGTRPVVKTIKLVSCLAYARIDFRSTHISCVIRQTSSSFAAAVPLRPLQSAAMRQKQAP